MSGYQLGDVVIYNVHYRDQAGKLRGKPRPLIIVSESNSKGDLLAVAGSSIVHHWVDEPHILLTPETEGLTLRKNTIFPVSKQILANPRFIHTKIGQVAPDVLEQLLRLMSRQQTTTYFKGIHKPKLAEPFLPGKSRVNYAGRVFDESEMCNLVDSSLEFWLTHGRYSREFEKRLAEFLGIKYAFLVNSGSSANLLAFMTLTSPLLEDRAVKRGDEVITVAAGFPTTVAPIIQYGAVPVFVDVDLTTFSIDVSKLEAALSPRTKAVMLAHTLGNPFDIQAVKSFCDAHNLWLIEDNCDALGSTYQGKYTGTWGDIGTSSFYPPHHMTMGEGGTVYTDNKLLKKIILSMRDWGRDCWCKSGVDNTCGCRFTKKYGTLPYGYDHKYVYSHFGYNLKPTDMQAAVGTAQLDKLEMFTKKRKENFRVLSEGLTDLNDIFYLPKATPESDPSWFGFMLTVKEGVSFTRNDITKYLEANNIQTRNLFAGNITRHPCFMDLKEGIDFRIAEKLTVTDTIMKDSFWIGVYPGMSEDALKYMVDTIRTFVESAR